MSSIIEGVLTESRQVIADRDMSNLHESILVGDDCLFVLETHAMLHGLPVPEYEDLVEETLVAELMMEETEMPFFLEDVDPDKAVGEDWDGGGESEDKPDDPGQFDQSDDEDEDLAELSRLFKEGGNAGSDDVDDVLGELGRLFEGDDDDDKKDDDKEDDKDDDKEDDDGDDDDKDDDGDDDKKDDDKDDDDKGDSKKESAPFYLEDLDEDAELVDGLDDDEELDEVVRLDKGDRSFIKQASNPEVRRKRVMAVRQKRRGDEAMDYDENPNSRSDGKHAAWDSKQRKYVVKQRQGAQKRDTEGWLARTGRERREREKKESGVPFYLEDL